MLNQKKREKNKKQRVRDDEETIGDEIGNGDRIRD
jgi:hypothetical protein